MKRRILSIVLTICMVLMLLPITVFAANDDATELQNLLNNGGTVQLTRDYFIDTTLDVKNTVTLDLNGHVIKMTGSDGVIVVSWCNLTLQDSNKTATHTDSTLPAGGVITGGNAMRGGGVYISTNGSMTMNGGTIANCSAENGGGVATYNGSFTMNGGTIKNCTATNSDYNFGGGGVYVASTCSMTMNGGTIENCSSTTTGGGVFSKGNFSMSGNAIIRGCSAKIVGGVNLDDGHTFTMTGGTIEACTSTNGTFDAVRIGVGAHLLANGGIVKGTVIFALDSAINTTSTDSYTKFYNEIENYSTISGGVYYGGISDNGTVTGTYHTVTFDTNGGSSVPTQWFFNTDMAPALQPSDPTKDGFVFAGWYNGDTKYDFTQSVTSDITLTAKWVTTNVSTEAELKEALDTGATSIKLDSDFKLSSTLDLTDKIITIDLNGYVLTGNIQLSDNSALPNSILTIIDSRPTATHSDSSLPVGGVVNGKITLTRGSGSVSHLYANGGTVTGQTSLPSYAGGIFCTSDTPTAFKAYVGNYGEIHGGMFYGSVNESSIKEKTVTFMNGSSRYALEVVADGNNVVAPISSPIKAGYDFDGWYDGDTKYTFGSTLSDNITLTAKFSNPINYDITYNLDGGTATNPATYNVESDAITLNNPVKTGYTFTGWSGTGLTGENNMTVTIAKGSTDDRAYTAHFSQNNYTVIFDTVGGSSISDKAGVKWTDQVLDGITAPTKEGFEFTGWKCGDVTVNANTKYSDLATNDTVASVTLVAQWKDITVPTGEISVGTNKWKGFLNTITFGLFFKDTQTVTITASDNSGEDVTIEYLLSDRELTVDQLNSATFNAYNDKFSINPDNKYVIYARLTDHAGNVTYISSEGVVLDATAPVISGVENGKTYCEAQTVTVTEEYIESVKVNGTAVTLDANNQFTLNPAEGTQTIVVTDKAGNVSAEITVTVNNGHTAGNDDGNCSTPVYCIYHPDTVVVAEKSHDFSGEWHNDENGHWHICQNDGCTVAQPQTPHSGTDDGDCTTAVICECGYTITAANADHTYEWQSENGQYWKKCQYCDDETAKKDIPTIAVDAPDMVCRTQDYKFSFTLPEGATDADSGYEFTNMGGGIKLTAENGMYSGVLETQFYDENEISFKLKAYAKTTDGFVFFSEKTVAIQNEHAGGVATCIELAICDTCGEEYGELDSTNHNLEKIPAKAATVTETGNTGYWHCKDCGKYFADENGENEIELADTVIAKLPPEIIEGKGQSITEGEKKELSFTSSAAFSDFIRAQLDGKTLDEKYYTVKEGSTVVTLKADYVATLSVGEHTIGIVSESGTATTTFTVKAKSADNNEKPVNNNEEPVNNSENKQGNNTKPPKTGDNSPTTLWIALFFVSGGLLTVTGALGKKKKHSKH